MEDFNFEIWCSEAGLENDTVEKLTVSRCSSILTLSHLNSARLASLDLPLGEAIKLELHLAKAPWRSPLSIPPPDTASMFQGTSGNFGGATNYPVPGGAG